MRVFGPASQWPIPHIKAAISLLVMVREERLNLDPEIEAYEVSRLKYYLTTEKDVRHIDAKEAATLILGADPTPYRRNQFSEFVKADPYLAKLFSQEKGIREDQIPLIKVSFEKMTAEKRKKSAQRNAALPRTRSLKTQQPKKVKNIFK